MESRVKFSTTIAPKCVSVSWSACLPSSYLHTFNILNWQPHLSSHNGFWVCGPWEYNHGMHKPCTCILMFIVSICISQLYCVVILWFKIESRVNFSTTIAPKHVSVSWSECLPSSYLHTFNILNREPELSSHSVFWACGPWEYNHGMHKPCAGRLMFRLSICISQIILLSNIMVQNRIKNQFFNDHCTKTCECKLVMSLAKCTSLKTKSSIYDFSIVVTNVNMNEWFCWAKWRYLSLVLCLGRLLGS